MDELADMQPGVDVAMNRIIAARGGPALGRSKLRIVLRRLEGNLGPNLDEDDDDLRIVRLLASAIADIEGEPYLSIPAQIRQVAS